MAANHPASPGCNPLALMWATLVTTCRLAWTCPALPHRLCPNYVPKCLLPRGSWHSTAECVCGTTAHVRTCKVGTQHGQTTPGISGRSHFQRIFNMALTSAWPTPMESFAGYMKQTQETLALGNIISGCPPLPYSKNSWIIYFIRNVRFLPYNFA